MDFFNFAQIDSDLTVWFIVDGKEYEVGQFSTAFGQGVDDKGQPQDETRGGRILVSLTQTLPENIYKWAMKTEPKNAVLEFRSRTASSPLKMELSNAYCINLKRDVASGSGVKTTLFISPENVRINGIDFDNHWVH